MASRQANLGRGPARPLEAFMKATEAFDDPDLHEHHLHAYRTPESCQREEGSLHPVAAIACFCAPFTRELWAAGCICIGSGPKEGCPVLSSSHGEPGREPHRG